MSERDAVDRVERPVTLEDLKRDLRALGVEAGDLVLVHASLSAMGWVCGGAVAVIQALLEVVGAQGTIVMPAHSADHSDPAFWQHPPVPEPWWPLIRETMPAFDPALTPTRGMGRIAETFRHHPHARRSTHPEVSFVAVGAKRDAVVESHPLDDAMGEASPLARVYDLDGNVLLIGVDHDRNTSLHLAEYRSEWGLENTIRRGAPVLVEGVRRWVEYDDVATDPTDFVRIGNAFERQTGAAAVGKVGAATSRRMPQRALVDFATDWIDRYRPKR